MTYVVPGAALEVPDVYIAAPGISGGLPGGSGSAPVLSGAPAPGGARLSWTAATGATSYSVYQSIEPDQEVFVAGSITGLSFTVPGLANGVTYYFKVRGNGPQADTDLSNEVAVVPLTFEEFILSMVPAGGTDPAVPHICYHLNDSTESGVAVNSGTDGQGGQFNLIAYTKVDPGPAPVPGSGPTSVPGIIPGSALNAMSFVGGNSRDGGTSTFFANATSFDFNIDTTNFSMDVWFVPTPGPFRQNHIVEATSSEYVLVADGASDNGLWIGPEYTGINVGVELLHVTLTVSGGTLKQYLAGENIGTIGFGGFGTDFLGIAASLRDSTPGTIATIQSVTFWQGVLSDEQVAAIDAYGMTPI